MEFKRVGFLIFLLSLLTIFWYYQSKGEKKSLEIILDNKIDFMGSVISYDKSMNHSFGVIRFKVIKSNKITFTALHPKLIFPYRLEKGYGEFYGYLPLEIKVGQVIKLNAGEKSVKLYNGKSKSAQLSLFVISDSGFIEYVNQHHHFGTNGRAAN